MQYSVREETQDFFLKGKKISDSTVIVRFYTHTLDHYYYTLQSYQKSAQLIYENNTLIGYDVYYAKIDIEDIYKACREGMSELILDECFIPEFSFDRYLKTMDIDIYSNSQNFECPFPHLISARLSFFEDLDFSRLSIESLEFLSYGSFFGGRHADFSQITINKGFLDFSRTLIAKNVKFSLSFTHIKDGDILFNYAYFEEGMRYFISLFLHKGSMHFSNSYMLGGSLNLSYSDISEGIYADKMYLKDLSLNLSHAKTKNIIFSFTEIRDSRLICYSMDIGGGSKSFEELYLESSSLILDYSIFKEGKLNFSYSEATQGCEISMKNVFFDNMEEIDFSYSLIDASLQFSYTNFENSTLNFSEAVLDNVSLDNIFSSGNINFRAKSCYALSLKGASLGTVFTISPHIKFEYLQLTTLVTEGKFVIYWKENNLYQAIKNMYLLEIKNIEQKFPNKIKNIRLKELEHLYAQSFLMLKDNFNLIHRYPEEDLAYVCHRRSMREYHMHSKKISSYIGGFSEWFLLDLLGGYGTDPWRSLIGIIVVWLGFAGSYYYVDSFSIAESSIELSRLGRSLYHSGITLFTIGYGDLVPTGIIMRSLSIMQGFFGVLLPSYFMISFTRKMLR
ncbi:MAG: potassium channel family protein [Brevinema sp.]